MECNCYNGVEGLDSVRPLASKIFYFNSGKKKNTAQNTEHRTCAF